MQNGSENNSSELIPLEFEKPWGVSDVILVTNSSEGRPLHVNKGVLGTFSPVFKAMFFGEFAEKEKGSVEIEADYETMKEILRIIHNSSQKVGPYANEPLSADFLCSLFTVADKYDFPLVRNLCKRELEKLVPTEALRVAICLGLHDQKTLILKRMSPSEILVFLSQEQDDSLTWSTNDLTEILRKFGINRGEQETTNQRHPIPTNLFGRPVRPFAHEHPNSFDLPR